jgi:N-ethylmaleimide reductase
MNKQRLLFTPFLLGSLKLPNHIVMAPLTRSRANDEGIPSSFAAKYYSERAAAGLIISEGTNISSQARGFAFTPGIWNEAQVEAWKPIVEAVHQAGGTFYLQLWHTGRISHPSLHGGTLPIAPSAVTPIGHAFTKEGKPDYVTPRAVEASELPGILEEYSVAAANAKKAGFDGVEIHSANAYFLDQWLRDSTNLRADEYGGTVENRVRFPLAAVRATIEGFGDASRVGVRVAPLDILTGKTPLDSNPAEIYGHYISELSKLGLSHLHMVEGVGKQSRELEGVPLDFQALRHRFDGVYIANNMYTSETAEAALVAGEVDLVSFGRPFLANPDLVERFRIGAELAEAPMEFWYGGTDRGYSDWPTLPIRRAKTSPAKSRDKEGPYGSKKFSYRRRHRDVSALDA